MKRDERNGETCHTIQTTSEEAVSAVSTREARDVFVPASASSFHYTVCDGPVCLNAARLATSWAVDADEAARVAVMAWWTFAEKIIDKCSGIDASNILSKCVASCAVGSVRTRSRVLLWAVPFLRQYTTTVTRHPQRISLHPVWTWTTWSVCD